MRSAIDFFSRILSGADSRGFDAHFYLTHYEDLRSLKTRKRALRHYLNHGKAEGRFPNGAAYQAHVDGLREGFDLAAYKFYNRDLAHRFGTEAEFFRHYVRHGHREGRPCRFPDEGRVEQKVADADKWRAIFSPGDFLAWCGAELDEVPTTRDAALALFEREGIDNIWPINLDYAFDPVFVRANGLLPGHESDTDADLYRAWLSSGFPAGVAPNERIFLAPYLAGAPFPVALDWEAIGRRLGSANANTRSRMLLALFETPTQKILSVVDLLGAAAAMLLDRIGSRALIAGDYERAVALFARCVAIAPTPQRVALLADAQLGKGAVHKALEGYRSVMASEEGPLRAFLEAVTILSSQHDFAAAYDVLRAVRPARRRDAAFVNKVEQVVRAHFDHSSALAHTLYRQGETTARDDANRLLTATLDDIRDLYLELDDLPAPAGGTHGGYVTILANHDLPQCTHYRIEQKVRAFARAGISVRVFSHHDVAAFAESLIGASAAIFYRVGAEPAILRAILHANAMALPTWYEIDDLLFDATCYPDPFASFEGQITPQQYAGLQFGVPLFRYALSMCRSFIASTPALAERMGAIVWGGDGIVLRNGLDDRHDVAARIGAAPVRSGERVRIFYGSGTKAHNADFNVLVAPALAELMRRYPQVDLVIAGDLRLGAVLDDVVDRITAYPFIADITAYWSVLAACDINLAVLEPGPVSDCKSEIKWLEAAVLQVPSVVSGTCTYRALIGDGTDGLVADGPGQWHGHLERLVLDHDLRLRMGANARAKALERYDLTAAAEILRATFPPPAPKPAVVPRPLRVLICNVFYAPQSYGGATRVVEDNVKAFGQRWSDLEVAIFCSDEGAASAGRLRMDEVQGVPVYRLAVQPNPQINWLAFDDDHAEPFARVLDHFRPDIVHFHCIQHLTATIVEVALMRAVPYIVTLHDAWWISDNQFLVDRDGLLRLPGNDMLADSANARDPIVSLTRRQRLFSLLQKSEVNLTVSKSFERICADAGVKKLRVIENTTCPFDPLPHMARADGRVALGHIGGRTPYKGAGLVEAVLRRGEYANLHLTMVDGALSPGAEVELVWGTTPVTLIAPVPQARVAELYARFDVLLAPSTWPESFGLVTREALSAGLWVVASDLGAIGEAVENGTTGYRIDVSNPRGLADALSTIDSAPESHRSRQRAFGQPSRETDQARALHALYYEIAGASARAVSGTNVSDRSPRA